MFTSGSYTLLCNVGTICRNCTPLWGIENTIMGTNLLENLLKHFWAIRVSFESWERVRLLELVLQKIRFYRQICTEIKHVHCHLRRHCSFMQLPRWLGLLAGRTARLHKYTNRYGDQLVRSTAGEGLAFITQESWPAMLVKSHCSISLHNESRDLLAC